MTKTGYTQRHFRKGLMDVCLLALILSLLTGCGKRSGFDGSRVSGASEFQMAYSMLDQEEKGVLEVKAGERLQVALSNGQGTVDVIIGLEGKEPIYRGSRQQNAEFILEIAETGSYHISVSGHKAKGNASFTRIPGKQE